MQKTPGQEISVFLQCPRDHHQQENEKEHQKEESQEHPSRKEAEPNCRNKSYRKEANSENECPTNQKEVTQQSPHLQQSI